MPIKLSNEEARDQLMKCARTGINDIGLARQKAAKKNPEIRYGQDPAVPYLRSIIDGNYEGDLSGSCCYAISNLGANWSASKLTVKGTPEFDAKTAKIKMCKGLIKDFCNHKYN